MDRINRVISDKLIPASIFFAANGQRLRGRDADLGLSAPSAYKQKVCWEHTGHGSHQIPCKDGGSSEFSGYNTVGGDASMGSGGSDSGGGSNWSDKIDADTINAALETTSSLVSLFGKKEFSEVETSCGKQPKFLASKTRKQQWAQCASDYMKAKLEASKPKREKGLTTGEWIGIGIGSAALLATIVAVVISSKKKGAVIMQPAQMASPVRIIKR